VLLAAGGTGIAPLRSIMWDLLEREPEVAVSVVYSARSAEELAYLDELRRIEAGGRINLAITVTRGAGATWTGSTGRIDQSLISRMLTSIETRGLVCGPAAFVAEIVGLLRTAGVPFEKIVTEAAG
jgi:NAD(P)H-flavin reductase